MDSKALKLAAQILLFSQIVCATLRAQDSGATLSGTVTDSSGSPVSNAKIIVSNVFSGQTAGTRSDASGHYAVWKLGPGDYEITVVAEGFPSAAYRAVLASGSAKTLNIQLVNPAGDSADSASPAQSSGQEPSLSGLGFPSSMIKGNPKEQALLNKRSHMLQIHQKLGMITVGAMVAALIASPGAKGHHGEPGGAAGRNVHMALGATTAGLYAATAYFALAAPRVPGVKVRGPIRLHKAMAWIHGPGMIMTAVLGAMAYSQLSNGERVHGIAKYHSTAAIVTAAALGTAVFSVSYKF